MESNQVLKTIPIEKVAELIDKYNKRQNNLFVDLTRSGDPQIAMDILARSEELKFILRDLWRLIS